MKRTAIATVLTITMLGTLLAALPAAAQPSQACNTGDAPPDTTPLGVGAALVGDPAAGPASLFVCNDGTVVPPPGKGYVRVTVDPDEPSVLLMADGDSDNEPPPCLTGYAGVKVDQTGPQLIADTHGDYGSGSRPRVPEAYLFDLADCLGADAPELPELPDLPDLPEP